MRTRLTVRRWAALGGSLLAYAVLGAPAQAGAPPNDDFDAAATIARADGDVRGRSFEATKETGEPDHAGNPGGHSVWYRWIAPDSGQFAFVTFGSDFDTLLAVYTGTSVDALTQVAASEDAGDGVRQSSVSFRATMGTEYRIAVDGFGGKVGKIRLQWKRAPDNDNFAQAALLSGYGSVGFTTIGSTWEPGEPYPQLDPDDDYDPDGLTVWFRWTATETGPVSFATERTPVDTVLAVYAGDDLHELELLAANDDDPFFGCCESRVTFSATAGQSYAIVLDSLDGWGTGSLAWRRVILGTQGRNRLTGTGANEEIRGLGGADRIRAGGGDDLVLAGSAADIVSGGPGNDRVFGHGGADVLTDRVGQDVLHGGAGPDRLDTRDRAGADRLDGGPGDDRCLADRNDRITGCS
jgi:RTX calcium-binding nonapeptide repeat (4 copies)